MAPRAAQLVQPAGRQVRIGILQVHGSMALLDDYSLERRELEARWGCLSRRLAGLRQFGKTPVGRLLSPSFPVKCFAPKLKALTAKFAK
jgi:hypothetical protein